MFVTYKNTSNPHVTIHLSTCNQIKKHGGIHKYKNGEYEKHKSLADAEIYAKSTKLKVVHCSFCN
jgi:hypothetical protein